MGKYDKYYDARNVVYEIVRSDLLGPVFDEEIINEAPTSYYIMGKLYPKTNTDGEKDENTRCTDIEAAEGESSLAAANMKEPRAMGVTFTLKPEISELRVCLDYAFYHPYSLNEAIETNLDISRYGTLIEKAGDKEKDRMKFWKRESFSKETLVSVSENQTIEVCPGIFLKVFLHMVTENNEKIVTAVLTNERFVSGDNRDDIAKNTVMQPTINVFDAEGRPAFTEVRRQVDLTDNDELRELEMLYSSDKCYAQGHGCSVIWDKENEDPRYIKSDFMPIFNLFQMKAAEIPGNPVFNMQYLFSSDREDVITNLHSFTTQYRDWIDKQRTAVQSSDYAAYKQSAESNLAACLKICERIEHSIDLLSQGDAHLNTAWTAFKYANEAMFMQRCRTKIKESRENGTEPDLSPEKINWYPFQLAFILLEIASFVEPEKEDRKLVDLLWFPTGGGKTEAYLGIAAFEIFYRRLTNPDSCDGITVIMRYTLRLLTIQQYERASILICACELLRKKYDLAGNEISIGLWVGNNFTPGTIEEADTVLTKIMATGQCDKKDVDPCQIKICPWCGEKLYPQNYRINNSEGRMEIRCHNEDCDFCDIPLPVRLVDEDIYRHKPAFLVATVDKFAQIAIQDKTSALFSNDSDLLPPELIIQDELHLISGPLGTMTGIYEAAITNICENKGRPVKIVASTATIRNASKQVLALYGRNFNQFPPQGISANDSYFAVLAKPAERPARLYSGIMGVGTTFTTTIIRLYAAWLFASRYLVDLGYDDSVIDNFWTLTGYFNSIRELGATQTQIVDDIQSRYKYLKENKFNAKYPDYSGKDKYENSVELTSRMSNAQISEIIQEKLKRPYKKNDYNEVFDFVLASNMISVGVDVGRLGVMAVAGQSKSNAEYIQATSRVGRTNPGLVFTVYNAARSRDRSHYEQFSKYHSALYRYVEATSLTPFSDRARDRGLQALFVTLCRYFCPELMSDDSAANFRPDLEGVKKAERVIYSYVCKVDEREKDKVLAEIKDIENKWYDAALSGNLWYQKKGKPSLLQPDIDEDSRFRIMNSMRTVEPESGVYLVGEGE